MRKYKTSDGKILTEKELKELQENLLKQIAEKQSVIELHEARMIYSKYVEYTHKAVIKNAKTADSKTAGIATFQKYICDTIDKLLKNELLNDQGKPYEGITVSIPGQHGKSMCITETLPSYYLGQNPRDHVIEISYGDDLATKFGRRNKQKINEFGQQLFNIRLSQDSSSASDFEIDKHKGGMMSRGIGAGISGNPADLIIIDDPYKNRTDADSPTYKKMVIDEWLNTIRIRASAKCKYIIVHTRWNEDDLIGYLHENESEKWFKISFPVEAEEYEEVTGRNIGDPLLPESGKGKEWLQSFKQSFLNDPSEGGMRAWNSLMQQRPTSIKGNMIKRHYWQRYKLTLEMQKGHGFDELIQSWDCSFKDTDGSDFVAGGLWGRIGANCYLLDIDYRRMGIVETMNAIRNMTKKYPKAICKLIEDKANGPAVIQMMKVKVQGLIPVKAVRGKGERVNAVLPLWEAGNVFIPDEIEIDRGVYQRCPWADTVIDQCAEFRPEKKTQKDDLVDMSSQALNRFMYSYVKRTGRSNYPTGFTTAEELKDMGFSDMTPRKVVNLF